MNVCAHHCVVHISTRTQAKKQESGGMLWWLSKEKSSVGYIPWLLLFLLGPLMRNDTPTNAQLLQHCLPDPKRNNPGANTKLLTDVWVLAHPVGQGGHSSRRHPTRSQPKAQVFTHRCSSVWPLLDAVWQPRPRVFVKGINPDPLDLVKPWPTALAPPRNEGVGCQARIPPGGRHRLKY